MGEVKINSRSQLLKKLLHEVDNSVFDHTLAARIGELVEVEECNFSQSMGQVIIVPKERLNLSQAILDEYRADFMSLHVIIGNEDNNKSEDFETGEQNEEEADKKEEQFTISYLDPEKPEKGVLYIVAELILEELIMLAQLSWVAKLELSREFFADSNEVSIQC